MSHAALLTQRLKAAEPAKVYWTTVIQRGYLQQCCINVWSVIADVLLARLHGCSPSLKVPFRCRQLPGIIMRADTVMSSDPLTFRAVHVCFWPLE